VAACARRSSVWLSRWLRRTGEQAPPSRSSQPTSRPARPSSAIRCAIRTCSPAPRRSQDTPGPSPWPAACSCGRPGWATTSSWPSSSAWSSAPRATRRPSSASPTGSADVAISAADLIILGEDLTAEPQAVQLAGHAPGHPPQPDLRIRLQRGGHDLVLDARRLEQPAAAERCRPGRPSGVRIWPAARWCHPRSVGHERPRLGDGRRAGERD
jgi:hypothetical protein